MNSTSINRHTQPPVFNLTYLTTLCERFGFYVLSFLVVLYAKSVYGLSDTAAFALFSVFTALAFLTPALGGYLADNFIGIRRCIIWGLFLEGTGLVLAAIPNRTVFLAALALIILGVGLFKTAPTNLLARSYEENDPRIDSGFTIYYMAINIGSLISSIVAGVIQKYFGWHVAFLIGGLGIYLGLVLYWLMRKSAVGLDTPPGNSSINSIKAIAIILGVLLSGVFCAFLIDHSELSNTFFSIATLLMLAYFVVEVFKSPREEKLKIIACLYLIIIGFACAVLYFQMFTSLELFIDRSVVHNILGINVPTVIFLSLNPIFVILLGPVLAFVYNYLAAKGKDLSVITKLTVGLLATGLCFFFIVIGSHFLDAAGKISWVWIVGLFFLFTIGDLMNSALGVAMVTRIAPKRMYGVMMGAWFLVGNALAAALSGKFAGIASIPSELTDPFAIVKIYSSAFTKIGVVSVIVAIITFMINPFIKKIVEKSQK